MTKDPSERSRNAERALIDAALGELGGGRETGVSPEVESSPVVESLRAAGYAVLREIHRGGQGVVYEATQQSTGRSVAVKVLRAGPVANADERARFDLEVRVLARLKHPNIVTVHDSGEVAGFYNIVMDYVRGEALDDYVVNEEPDARTLLGLFAAIADAVAAAHRNGIIHRDLKPSNIRIDEERVPKVLDFGLAKLADAQAGSGGITHTGQFVGSIPWTSPEQADGRHDLVDVRTDVYALGVMLFQMLTRRFPYDVTGSVRATLHAIVHTDPPRPSGIRRELDDEIDTIVLKALAKAPERRYQTAFDLARDIRRYLAGEPIEAKSDSTAYLLRKMLRRHRVPLAVAAAFILLIGGSGWVAAVLHRRTVEIREQSIYSESDFFRDLLESVNPQGIDLPADRVREKLARATQRLDADLAELPEARANLQHAIGVTYRRIGMFDEALEQLRGALNTRTRLYDPPHAKLAETFHELGAASWHNAEYAVAKDYYRQALAQRRTLFGEHHVLVADTLNHLAACMNSQGDYENAERLYRRALELRRSLLGPQHPDVAAVMNNLATCLHHRGASQAAIELFRKAIDMMRKVHGEQHPFVARGMTNLANLLIEDGRVAEADQMLRTALRIKRQTQGAEHPSVATTLHRLAELRLTKDDLEAAEEFVDEAVAIRRGLRAGHPDLAASLGLAGRIRLARDDAAAAQPLLEEAWRLHLQLDYAPTDPRRSETLFAYARCEARLGRHETACAALSNELRLLEQSGIDSAATQDLARTLCGERLGSPHAEKP